MRSTSFAFITRSCPCPEFNVLLILFCKPGFGIEFDLNEVKRPCKLQCKMYNVQCAMYNVQCEVYNVECAMYNVQCTMYKEQGTMNILQCAVNIVQCAMCSKHVHSTLLKVKIHFDKLCCTFYNILLQTSCKKETSVSLRVLFEKFAE